MISRLHLTRYFSALSLLGVLASGPIGCNDDDPVDTDEELNDDWRVEVDESNGNWKVFPPSSDESVLASSFFCSTGRRQGLQLGVGTVDNAGIAGQFRLDFDAPSLTWFGIDCSNLTVTRGDDGTRIQASIDVGSGPEPIALVFQPYREGDLFIGIETNADVNAGSIAADCASDESFFGLGSQVVGMDLAGRTYPLWTQESGIGKKDNPSILLENSLEAAHAPLGVWHSSAGYSAVIGTDAFSELALCDSSQVRLRTLGDLPSFALFAGETPKDRLENITGVIGRITDPAPWTFGHWHDSVRGPDRLAYVSQKLRDEDIPTSAIWAEDWIGSTPNLTGFRLSYEWQWDADTYPNLPATIDSLHDDGFAFLGYFNPFVRTSVEHYDEGVANGYLIEKQNGSVYTFADPSLNAASWVDLTDPAARDWFKGFATTAARDLGIDGWMADFAEWSPLDAVYDSELNPYIIHNIYPLLWQQIQREVLEEVHSQSADEADNNWNFFARSGWASLNGGSPGLAQIFWAADQETDFSTGDGLPSVIPIGMHLGMAGVSIFGSDIAGYSSFGDGNATKELFFRWTSMAAFHPLMRTHHGSDNCENWSFDTDEESTDHFRRYAQIHTLLYPYFDELSNEAVERGLPMVRHPYLVDPELSGLWTDTEYQFFLGDDLLVAPTVTEGATERDVRVPTEDWWPLFDPERLGVGSTAPIGGTVQIAADNLATEIPVYVRPGTALFLLPEAVDTFYPSKSGDVTDLSDVKDRYAVALYPNTDGSASRSYDGITIDASKLSTTSNLLGATFGGASLPACEGDDGASCIDGEALILIGDNVEVDVANGTIRLTANRAVRVRVGIADDAWGSVAKSTLLTDLTPEGVTPFCRETTP